MLLHIEIWQQQEGGRVGFLLIFSFPVLSKSVLNGILVDFWRQKFDLNIFIVQLSWIF